MRKLTTSAEPSCFTNPATQKPSSGQQHLLLHTPPPLPGSWAENGGLRPPEVQLLPSREDKSITNPHYRSPFCAIIVDSHKSTMRNPIVPLINSAISSLNNRSCNCNSKFCPQPTGSINELNNNQPAPGFQGGRWTHSFL